jgi:hypothetical protein
MRCVSDGFELQGPTEEADRSKFDDVCSRYEVTDSAAERFVLTIPQHDHGHGCVDAIDRVIVGADFLRDLVDAGL